MEPVMPETLTDDDTEFDLDVKVLGVARVWAKPGEKPHPSPHTPSSAASPLAALTATDPLGQRWRRFTARGALAREELAAAGGELARLWRIKVDQYGHLQGQPLPVRAARPPRLEARLRRLHLRTLPPPDRGLGNTPGTTLRRTARQHRSDRGQVPHDCLTRRLAEPPMRKEPSLRSGQ
jgi:hypothetical protein